MYLKYLWYVIRHKWFVLVECAKVGLLWRGLVHDLSKFLPVEFFPYAKYFYGTPKHANEKEFDLAWREHLKRNKHHWNHWVNKVKMVHMQPYSELEYPNAKEMPLVYVKEMVADWVGAGKAITGKNDILSWYDKNKDLMTLHPNTRKLVEELLQRYK